MSTALAAATAATFVWLGAVLAISFLEAPLKFRAPGITIPLGLAIGRLVFRALNAVEAALAAVIVGSAVAGSLPTGALWWLSAAIAMLVLQVVAVRPALTRRTDAVLAGGSTEKRSHAHLVYVALELVKVVGLTAGGIALLSAA